jgi:hypothetical protein
MNVDFKNAANRHYRDGELLYQNARWANADQLYGLSAECVLKWIIVGLDPGGVDRRTGDFSNSKHKKHLEDGAVDNQGNTKDLWVYLSVNLYGRLAQHNPLPNPNPFKDWRISQRYAHDNEIDQQQADRHRLAAEDLMRLLDNNQLSNPFNGRVMS